MMGNHPYRTSPEEDPQVVLTDNSLAASTVTVVDMAYIEIAKSIGELVTEKQAAYGDSFGKSGAVMRIFYPDGIPLEKMDDSLTVIRTLDKLFRVATDRDALGESPWRDIAGYAILAVKRQES